MDEQETITVSVIVLKVKPFELVGWDQDNQRLLNILYANSGVNKSELAVGKLFQCEAYGIECGNVDIVFRTGSVSDGWNGNSTNVEVGFSSNQKHISFNREFGVSEKFGLILINRNHNELPDLQSLQVYNTTIAVRTDIRLLSPNDPAVPMFTTIALLAPINGGSDLLLKLGKLENELLTRKISFIRDLPFFYEFVVRNEAETSKKHYDEFSAPQEHGLLYKFSKKYNGKVITCSGEYKLQNIPRDDIDVSQCGIGYWVSAKINRKNNTASKVSCIGKTSKVSWEVWGSSERPTVVIDLFTGHIFHSHNQFHYYKHSYLGFIEVNSDYFDVGSKTIPVRVMRRDNTCYLPKGPSHWFVCGIKSGGSD